MALFSRRKKSDAPAEATEPEGVQPDRAAPEAVVTPTVDAPTQEPPIEGAPTVGISVTSWRGAGAPSAPAEPVPPRAAVPAEAPDAEERVPGMRDNGLLREALQAMGPDSQPADLMNVTRQLFQGHVFLRVRGDARTLLSEGQPVPLAVVRNGDRQFLLAFSSGEAVQASIVADQGAGDSVMGQPVANVLRHVLDGPYAGIVLDQSSGPARAVIPRELLERALEEGDDAFVVKGLLSTPRTPETAAAIGAALLEAPLWVAVGEVPSTDPEQKPRVGVAESHTPDGSRYLEVFSHPLEVIALKRGNQPVPFTPLQLATSLRDHPELTGVVVDPAGPWIRLVRDDLAPLLALADAG